MRVLHCPEIVGGNAYLLARAERDLGLHSRCVALQPHPFGYPADEFMSTGGPLAREVARWRLLALAWRKYDVIHFNFGQSTMACRVALDVPSRFPRWLRRTYNFYASLVELKDLEWLKRRGKTIVVTYQGDDARQANFLREHFEISPATDADYYSEQSDRLKRERIRLVSHWADAIFALNPDLLHVLPAQSRFLPYANVDVTAIDPAIGNVGDTPVVLHAPSHRGVKGTRYILEAVSRLKTEGVRFEFILVEGILHADAMHLYRRADLLVDQLLVGWYGGLAVELMALGKPVISFLREGDLGYLPSEMRNDLPVINASPDSIYAVLRDWLTVRRSQLCEVGHKSRAFVEKWHEPKKVAVQVKQVYEGLRKRLPQ